MRGTRKVKGLSRIHAYFHFKSQWRNLSRSPSFSFLARMPVPKMVKSGINSVLHTSASLRKTDTARARREDAKTKITSKS